jgi:hypothetical protein
VVEINFFLPLNRSDIYFFYHFFCFLRLFANPLNMQDNSETEREVLIDALGPAISRLVQASNQINTKELSFQLAESPESREILENQSDRIMGLINKLVCFVKDIPNDSNLLNSTDVLDEFGKFVEITDDLLEKSVCYREF